MRRFHLIFSVFVSVLTIFLERYQFFAILGWGYMILFFTHFIVANIEYIDRNFDIDRKIILKVIHAYTYGVSMLTRFISSRIRSSAGLL
jgi:hypothetical protein